MAKCNRTRCDREADPACVHSDGREGSYCQPCAIAINSANGLPLVTLPVPTVRYIRWDSGSPRRDSATPVPSDRLSAELAEHYRPLFDGLIAESVAFTVSPVPESFDHWQGIGVAAARENWLILATPRTVTNREINAIASALWGTAAPILDTAKG